jgi:multicomponent Na+:H+ antiporter subunit E
MGMPQSPHWWKRALVRLVLFALLWVIIAGSSASSWVIGAPTVLLAAWVSVRLSTNRTNQPGLRARLIDLSLIGTLRFIPFFLKESLMGGIDVARRVLRYRVQVDPGFVDYRPRLTDQRAQVAFLNSISLLPGTLSADMRDGLIKVHALDVSSDLKPALERLEHVIGCLFGCLPEPPEVTPNSATDARAAKA